MPDQNPRDFLVALLSDETGWAIFDELARMTEVQRAPILRPHDEIRLQKTRELTAIGLRRRLDIALGNLTLLEIGFETGLVAEERAEDLAWRGPGLTGFQTLVAESESFFGYAGAYLYFGARILAYRYFGACWPPRQPTPGYNDGSTNRRSFPIAVPPRLVMPTPANPELGDAVFAEFLEIRRDERWNTAWNFLDGFQPKDYGESTEGEAAGANHEEIPGDTESPYQEPAEYELWLRGLLPEVNPDVKLRFQEISDGLVAWALALTDFYSRLQPMGFYVDGSTWVDPPAPENDGVVLKNPLTGRFALADIYWMARVLRAEVSSDASVSYSHISWLSLLVFKANLDGKSEKYLQELKWSEKVLQRIFNFGCDLAQNAVALSEQRENRHFNPWQFPQPDAPGLEGRCTKEWRAVFDEELREIDRQRSRRTYTKPAFPPNEAFPYNAQDADHYWSERLITGRQPYNRVGLAFSGGGIRSATFNLGVLQGLQELNLLRYMDYLSTVSGGGFIGSWLAGNVKRTRQWLTKGTRWDESIDHLRSYSSYLAPLTGVLSADTWTLGASWARNTFLIQLTGIMWLFALLLFALGGRMIFLALARGYPAAGITLPLTSWLCSGGLHLPWAGMLALLMGGVAAVHLARNFKDNRVETGESSPRGLQIRRFVVLPCWVGAFVVAAILCSDAQHWQAAPPQSLSLLTSPIATCKTLMCSGVSGVTPMPTEARDYSFLLKRVWEWLDVLLVANWVALLLIGAYALQPAEKPGGRWAKYKIQKLYTPLRCVSIATACSLVLYLGLCAVLGLSLAWVQPADRFGSYAFVFGPALVLSAFTLSVVMFIGLSGRGSNEAQREWWTRFGAWLLIYALVGLGLSGAAVLGPKLLIKTFEVTPGWLKAVRWGALLGSMGTVIGGVLAGKSSKTAGDGWSQKLEVLARAGGLTFVLAATLATATVLYYLLLNITTSHSSSDCYWAVLNDIGTMRFVWVCLVVVLCGLAFSRYFEINIFGLSQLYRNRLVRCYLGATRWAPGVRKPHPFTKFDFHDDMRLSDLNDDFRGPFPIFNCTLNLGGSSDLALHSRHSASFSLTPLRCGADRPKVGYAPTGNSSAPESSFANGVKLGQAVAISGAAASPNMGYNTSPLVALLLTMFNVRLGWWFPNPGRKSWAKRGLSSSLSCLARELLGTANENRDFLNVSDGGHFENLGVYELIRRRCKVIIACDAECDELLQFGSLGNLVRICATDFGAEIDLDVRSIARQKEGRSLAHSAVGKIKYSNGSIGYLIYLKASITGDEDIGVAQYRSAHPSFPHETTANQFYSEAQFESYRMLGRHVVEHAFRGVQVGENPLSAAEKLEDVSAPARGSGEAYLKHTRALEALWERFRRSPALHSFLDELMAIHPPVAVVPATGTPHQQTEELCAALELIQLMEDVFMDLQLDDFWEHPDNRGWAMLFMRWARSLRFRQYWNQTHRTIGIRFEYFCAARLGLTRDDPIVRV
jgi:hypothetical protein